MNIKYLTSKKNKIIAMCVVVIIACGTGVVFAIRDTSPGLRLKKDKFTIEYGKHFNPTFNELVNTKDLNVEDIHYLQHNVKIKSNVKNEVETVINQDGTTSEKDKGYAKVGDYKITLTYKNKDITVAVKVKDTVAPELTVPENVEIVQGTDLATFDFKSLITATDLAQLNDVQIDHSTVDVNNPAEYTAKASIEDINKNKTEKEFKITVVATDSNVEITTQIVTDPATGQRKSVVTTKPKINTTTSSSSSTNNGNSSNNSSNSGSSKPSTGGSTSSSTGGSSGGSTSGNTGGSTGGGNSGNTGGSTGGNTGGGSERPKPTTTHWIKCKLCGLLIESNVSLDDAFDKLKSKKCEVDGYIYEGITAHSSYSYGSRQN
ncbi:hypothetical protein [Thomasclavelia cocleata]|uniref:hypothetical protein n=1 Tax=Thomasclavelia cocleata TaxID=69824 RepID=UPI00272E3131|nr:hypothetical protein [Thomasclavelia cocleata]